MQGRESSLTLEPAAIIAVWLGVSGGVSCVRMFCGVLLQCLLTGAAAFVTRRAVFFTDRFAKSAFCWVFLRHLSSSTANNVLIAHADDNAPSRQHDLIHSYQEPIYPGVGIEHLSDTNM